MTFGVESSQSKSYVTTIIQDFILVTLTFTVMPHPVGLPLRATVLSHPMYLSTYALDFLLLT